MPQFDETLRPQSCFLCFFNTIYSLFISVRKNLFFIILFILWCNNQMKPLWARTFEYHYLNPWIWQKKDLVYSVIFYSSNSYF